ncbi:MAG TPA: hypothetical protein PK329_08960 [Myxococcota bacterium]|nr:hypothetical protein [Myxococcota bacterium]HON26492.1 hypothetical protein [Myxococcota bacterium]HOS62551.1 hypothetical protein [Myxococcota bacterium]HPC92305.1 hypothetical protein [Myxococcota bacterium]HPL25704.1 hypothetical protein [Myxococcota bacterium]
MRRTSFFPASILAFACIFIAASGCSNTETVEKELPLETGEPSVDVSEVEVSSNNNEPADDLSEVELPLDTNEPADDPVDDTCQPDKQGQGCTCVSSVRSCANALCMSTEGRMGYRCAEPCGLNEGCRSFEACMNMSAGEPVYFCWDVRDRLCLPCKEYRQCFGGTWSICASLPQGGDEKVCLITCDSTSDCPEDYDCMMHPELRKNVCSPSSGQCPPLN